MNVNIVGWGYTGIQLVKHFCSQQIPQKGRTAVTYYTISEYQGTAEFAKQVTEFVIGCDVSCPSPMAGCYACNDIFGKKSAFKKLTDADILIHLISSENAFVTGAVQAYANFLLKTCGNREKPFFQIALVLLPSMEEDAATAGRFLIQLTGTGYRWFDLVILLEREGPLFKKENMDVLDEYVHQFISLFTALVPDSNLLHFMSKMDAGFFSFSMKATDRPKPDLFIEHILKFVISSHSIDLFDGKIRYPVGFDALKAFPRVKKIKEVFLIAVPTENYKELETEYRKNIGSLFVNADIFYLDFNGMNFSENFRNLHIMFLAQPLTYKILLMIGQYTEKYWHISASQFETMLLFENPLTWDASYEILGQREKKFVKNYLANMKKSITDSDYLLTDYSVSKKTLESSLKLLRQWLQK